MKGWIRIEDLIGHINEYGQFSYGYIVYQIINDDELETFVEVTSSHHEILDRIDKGGHIGLVRILQNPDLVK